MRKDNGEAPQYKTYRDPKEEAYEDLNNNYTKNCVSGTGKEQVALIYTNSWCLWAHELISKHLKRDINIAVGDPTVAGCVKSCKHVRTRVVESELGVGGVTCFQLELESVFKTAGVGVGFSKLLESESGVGFLKLLESESGVGTFVAITDSNV